MVIGMRIEFLFWSCRYPFLFISCNFLVSSVYMKGDRAVAFRFDVRVGYLFYSEIYWMMILDLVVQQPHP